MAEKNSNEPLILETERFLLRSLETKDATDTYISWWNDKEIQEGLGARPRNWGQIEAERHINKFDNQRRYHLGIFPKGEDVPIGFFTIFLERGKIAQTVVVIGNKDYWGAGVPFEIRTRALEFLFNTIKVEKVYGKINGRNYASIYNYKALGFVAEGVQRKQVPGPEGKRLDVLFFGLLREEW